MLRLFALLMLASAMPALAQEDQAPQEVDVPVDISPLVDPEREYSPAEMRLLQELEKRRIELDRRSQALDLRERLVSLAEIRVVEQSGRLTVLKGELEQLLANLSKKEDQELEQLARIYSAMKPASAAEVLNGLDNTIVYDIFVRMKQATTAKIIEKMNPSKARIITQMLAEKQKLPEF